MKRLMGMLAALIVCFGCACAENISPTTGLPLNSEPVAPMLAVISHTFGDTEVDGRKVSAAGVGKRQAWGGQQADIIYESLLYQEGCSRFAYLYHDALVNGERIEAGPLRSVRDLHIQLSELWQAGLIYGSGNTSTTPALEGLGERAMDTGMPQVRPHITTVRRMAPDHRSADVTALHELLTNKTFTAAGFTFSKEAPAADLPAGTELHLQWGGSSTQVWTTHFVYEASRGQYLCYTGKAPLKNDHDTSFTEESQLCFENVIVQYATYSYPRSKMMPEVDLTAGGKAMILRGGKRIEARWVNDKGRIRWVDEQGNDVPLTPGKTYIAVWPDDRAEIEYQ